MSVAGRYLGLALTMVGSMGPSLLERALRGYPPSGPGKRVSVHPRRPRPTPTYGIYVQDPAFWDAG